MVKVKLSPRMQAVADMACKSREHRDVLCKSADNKDKLCVREDHPDVPCEKTVADIGCDHAFVSIYLVSQKFFDKAIAMDVKKGPLLIAEKNIELYGVSDKVVTRLSDGFDKLDVCEADTAVMAGMGGELMVDILRRGSLHTNNGISLVLQPQSEPEKVRKYILDIGYKITDEIMLIDEEKYYVVIRADKCDNADKKNKSDKCDAADNKHYKSDDKPYNHSELLYGRILIEKKDIILKEYLEKQLDKNNKLIISLEAAGTEHALRKIEELRQEERYIKDVLNKIS